MGKKLFISFWYILIAVIVGIVFVGPYMIKTNAYDMDLLTVYLPPGEGGFLGTDEMGRDVFARLLVGGQTTVTVAGLAVLLSTVIGILYGGLSGYYGGWLDQMMMRLLEAMLAIPSLLIMIALQAIIQGGRGSLILIIGFTSWMTMARLVRTQFIEVKQKNYVHAAKLMSTPKRKIFARHLLRNSWSIILVIAVFNFANAIFTEVSLSFLGIGIAPDIPSWGNMLTNAQKDVLAGSWWVSFFPGMMIVLTILSINFIGEELKKKFGIQGG